jgi:hypothetical protein
MKKLDRVLDWIGHALARRITSPRSGYEPYSASRPEYVARLIAPGDVLLVEGGRTKVAAAIKYLTQSTWSHAALYVGEEPGLVDENGEPATLVEAEVGLGIVAVPLSKYETYNTRICRPVGLTPEDRARVIRYAVKHVGGQYDMRNIIDLVRYLVPAPPLVPARFRRRLISLGSGEPTRAICSTLIARAFEKVRYPILPQIEHRIEQAEDGAERREEVLHIRHSSLFTPRDFDTSPFFRIIKPTIEIGFDYKSLVWSDPARPPPSEGAPRAIPLAPENPPAGARRASGGSDKGL